MINAMTIGSVLGVFRTSDNAASEHIGSGLIIHPQIVQLDDAASRLLRETPHRAEQIELRHETVDGVGSVARIRPGLVGYQEANELVRQHLPEVTLLEVEGDLVFLELCRDPSHDGDDGGDGDGDDGCEGWPVSQPWYCKIACILDCTC